MMELILMLSSVLLIFAGILFISVLHEGNRTLREKAKSLGIDLNNLKPRHYPEPPPIPLYKSEKV